MKREINVVIINLIALFLSASLWLIVRDIIYPNIQEEDGLLDITGICYICVFVILWIIVIFKLIFIITYYHMRIGAPMIKGTPGSGKAFRTVPSLTGEILEKNGFVKMGDNISYHLKYTETNGDFVHIGIELGLDKLPATIIRIQRARKENPEESDVRYEAYLEFDWIINVFDFNAITSIYNLKMRLSESFDEYEEINITEEGKLINFEKGRWYLCTKTHTLFQSGVAYKSYKNDTISDGCRTYLNSDTYRIEYFRPAPPVIIKAGNFYYCHKSILQDGIKEGNTYYSAKDGYLNTDTNVILYGEKDCIDFLFPDLKKNISD